MKIKSIIISSVAIIAFSSFAYAQDVKPTDNQDSAKQGKRGGNREFSGEKKHGRHGKDMMRGLHQLNLSDAQKEQMKSFREKSKSEFQPQRDEMKTLISKKREGIITVDEENRLKELKGTMKANAQKMHDEMMGILTPEQKVQFDQMKAEKLGKMKEHRQKRGEINEKPKDN
jgi:periplasmic protein CpxP/Spy